MLKYFTPFMVAAVVFASEYDNTTEFELPPNAKPATIRVLLKKECDGALVEVRGAYQVYDPKTGKRLSGGRSGKRFFMYPHDTGIKWGENFLGIYQLRITPQKEGTTFFIDGVQYKGTLEVYHAENLMTLINEVDIENYIKAILTPQFDAFYTDPVMEAIAIVARTDAYHRVLQNKEAFWHVNAKEVGFEGHAATLINPEIERAVDNTRFLVMTLEGKPFPCTWTGNCAGRTANYSAIYRKNLGTPQGIDVAFAREAREEHRWTFTIAKNRLAQLAKVNRITKLDLFVENESKKVYAVRIHDGAHYVDLDFFALQAGLGKINLLSNDFTVSIQGDLVIFDGFGQGGGVGLCLFSAGKMAKRGDAVPDILATFFPFSRLEKMVAFPDVRLSSNDNRVVIPTKNHKKGK